MLVRFSTRNGSTLAVNPEAVVYVWEVCLNGERCTEIGLGWSAGKLVSVTVKQPIETVIAQLNGAGNEGK